MLSDNREKDTFYQKYGTIINFGIIISIAVIIFRNFIFSSGWPAGGDTLGWVAREYLYGHDFRWLNLWRPYSFGFVEGINSIDFFLMLVYSTCQSGAVTVKVFMISTFIGAGLSMYAFAHQYTHNKLASISASLVYMLNHWIFTQYTEGHIGILLGYALAPILFLLLNRALNDGKIKDMMLFAVVISICLTGLNPLSVVIYTVFLALFIIFYVITPQNKVHFWNRIKRTLKVLVVSGTIFLCLSAFYIIPFVNNARASFYSTEFGYDIEEAFTNSYATMVDAFVLGGVEQYGYVNVLDVASGISLQIIPVSLIVLIIFLIAYSTIFFKTDRYTLYFLVAAIISIFLAKGPNPPYGNVFEWCWFNIPHFSVFRAANRFAMITAFCSAFFISVLVSILTGYVTKTRSLQTKEEYPEINSQELSPKNLKVKHKVSYTLLNKTPDRVKKFLYHGATLLLILILVMGLFSCWFFFQEGVQVYEPPETFLTPYNWISNQPQDFKIITVNRSPAEWELSPNPQTDFASAGMLTSIGWGHDIASESAFIHDKPVLGDGGLTVESRQFVNFLRFGIARNKLSDKLVKLLGTFDYKYVVVPQYASEEIREFFINQEGTELVYNQSGSLILENAFHTPRVFSTTSNVLVVGGFKSFFDTFKIDSLDISQNAFLFVDQFEDSEFLDVTSFDGSSLLFDDSNLLDLVMLSSDDINVIRAEQYATSSRNYSTHWGKSTSWTDFGVLTLGGSTLTTYGSNKVSIPFEVEKKGNYEISLRIGFTQNRGTLNIHVDGIPIGSVQPVSDSWTNLKWVSIGSLDLEKGEHEIRFTNEGPGWNDVDAIAVVESATLERQTEEVANQIQNYAGRIIHVLSALHTFADDVPSGWSINTLQYQGYVLESNYPSTRLAANTTILREGRYTFAVRLAQGPNEGTPQLYVDNKTVALRLLNSSTEAQWYETDPTYLTVSDHQIEIGATGKVAFDELIIYSLEDDEQLISLPEMQVHATELGLNVAPEGNASASSVGTWSPITLWAYGANDGNNNTRWASKPHEETPQWLQIEWNSSQEIMGASILFERAYAEDYSIQTWSGTRWITQVTVTGNTQLNRTHVFDEPAVTNKMRLLVTSMTDLYDLVSVWEFEAYTQPSVSSKITVPDEGWYRVDFCFTCGPEYGTLDLAINNVTASISCNSSETKTIHYETEPLYLHSGEQNITVNANGKTDLYAIALSLNDEGEFGFLDNIIEEKQGPKVTYDEINAGKYVAHVENSEEPFILVFSESYHPLWKAYIGDEEISPIPVYSIVNGFYINKTGNFDITLYFTGQTYADIGIQISAIATIIVLPIIAIPTKYFNKLGNYIKQKIFHEKCQPNVVDQKEGGTGSSE